MNQDYEYKYKAQDASGTWYEYTHCPVPYKSEWRPDPNIPETEYRIIDGTDNAVYNTVPNPNWKDTLSFRFFTHESPDQDSEELENLMEEVKQIIENSANLDAFGNSPEYPGENPFTMSLNKDIQGLKQWISEHSGSDRENEIFTLNTMNINLKEDLEMQDLEMQDLLTYCALDCKNWEHAEMYFRNTPFTRTDWFQKRQELINVPDDSKAPEWANYKAQDSDGEWYFYGSEPILLEDMFYNTNSLVDFASDGLVPAGHSWRATVTKIQEPEYDLDSVINTLRQDNADSYIDEDHLTSVINDMFQDESSNLDEDHLTKVVDDMIAEYCKSHELESPSSKRLSELQTLSKNEESRESTSLIDDITELVYLIDSTENPESKSFLLDTLDDLLTVLTGKHV